MNVDNSLFPYPIYKSSLAETPHSYTTTPYHTSTAYVLRKSLSFHYITMMPLCAPSSTSIYVECMCGWMDKIYFWGRFQATPFL